MNEPDRITDQSLTILECRALLDVLSGNKRIKKIEKRALKFGYEKDLLKYINSAIAKLERGAKMLLDTEVTQ